MRPITTEAWREILNMYVDTEGSRAIFEKPFEQDGYVYATDTHILIRVDKKHITDNYACRDDKFPNCANVIPTAAPTFAISADAILGAIKRLDLDPYQAFIECPECNNDGEVEWRYTDSDGYTHTMMAECPCCNDEGRIPNGASQVCKIGTRQILAHNAIILYRTMHTLEVDTANVTLTESGTYRFSLADGVDVIIVAAFPDRVKHLPSATIKTSKI